MYRNTHFLKHINITKHHRAFPEDDTNKVETNSSCINCKIIHISNNTAHFVSFNLHNFHPHFSIIDVQITLLILHNTNTTPNNQFRFIDLLFAAIYFRYLKAPNNIQNGP